MQSDEKGIDVYKGSTWVGIGVAIIGVVTNVIIGNNHQNDDVIARSKLEDRVRITEISRSAQDTTIVRNTGEIVSIKSRLDAIDASGTRALGPVLTELTNIKAEVARTEVATHDLNDAISKLRDSTADLKTAVGEMSQMIRSLERGSALTPDRSLGPHGP